ncbi:hypothetical protein Cfla_1259 [Cellulomonas flavigena DSM 20109]|uniref:Uncharacterized protein n=1 Tax=Cellulomonas flavigena (strain ATCC 482 / DSM 20109 / BCRC 11376 / JCM 18109 / NBRC 3775 / NCIMB 8073 / NRS 134) TaxID=446466 RepID=D5UBR4_CELFN|nr:hypothetical protein Cfla_1259 [Cellulomonas flavigena DSM 20109]
MRRAGVVAGWACALAAATGPATAVVPVAYAAAGEVAPGAVADATVRIEIAGDPAGGTVQELLVRLAVSGEFRNGRVWAL